ncbi:MAG: FMN-binding protein, partial [Aristaeellaceae bacterium]
DTDEFKAQFIGKKGPFEGVDIVAGATYTSNGIIEALNKLFPAEETAPAAEAAVLTATGVGFVNEDVTVTVTLNEDGTIATLAFDLSDQMEPVCNLVDTDEFKAQFIGKKGPFEGVDVVAGATYTSNGIIEALNKLFAAEETAPAADAEVLTATGVGFVNEDVTVIVTLNEDGTIATLAFDLSEQMEPVCNLVDTDEFKAQFIGKKGPFEGVDIVAGATYTSNGIIEALNKLFPAEEAAPAAEAAVLTAKGVGFVNEDVTVIVTLNEDGTIATLAFDLSEQMEPVCNLVDTDEFKAQFIGRKGPFEGVDVVAGATFTSNGIIEALNKLFPAEEAAPAAAEVLTSKGVGFVNEDVTVIVTLNEDGTIATLAFDLSEQMEPVCNLVDTDEFKAQFIGRKGPFEGVDIVAGATYTSNGIIEALNKLFPAE